MKTNSSALYSVGILTFFFTIFDGILAYVVPLDITLLGYSKTALGFILGTSSLAGAFGDILLSKFLKTSHFRKLFLAMYICALLYALILWKTNTLILYLLAMALWGIYFDFKSFATFNFVGRFTPHRRHAASFGIIDVFKCLGYVIAPIFAGLLIMDKITDKPFILALLFLTFSFLMYLVLLVSTKKAEHKILKHKNYSLLIEINTWRKLAKFILPVLLFTILISINDSFFWTVGPLISEELSQTSQIGGLFLTLYFLPMVFVGWFVGRITTRFGKKRTAFVSFGLGSVFLAFLMFLDSPMLILLIVLASSSLGAIAWPAINGAYADYIEESPNLEQEIEGVADFFYNISYVVGPILAGFLADNFGNVQTLSIFGAFGAIFSIILLLVAPKRIHVPAHV